MSQSSSFSTVPAGPRVRPPLTPARLFYVAAAGVMLVLAFVGFSWFYLHGMAHPGRPITPPIRTLVITHGVTMTAWLLLLLVQPLLILRGNRREHMMLGRAGAVLAGLILVLGVWLAISAASVAPPELRIWGLLPKEFMAIPFFLAWLFAAFVAVGVWYRRRPAIHRPMMLLATLAAVSAAVSRIEPLNGLYTGTVWERLFGPFFTTVVLGVLLFALRCAVTRSFDRYFAIGLGVLTVASAMITPIATTSAWAWFASLVVR